MSKDIPIIFSAPMVRALLEGRKTMTRRLALTSRLLSEESSPGKYHSRSKIMDSPWKRTKPGDRLWVRENWRPYSWNEDCEFWIEYPADGARSKPLHGEGAEDLCERVCNELDKRGATKDERGWYTGDVQSKTRPSIHMPRWTSRLSLIVSCVKVERLQDITDAEAIAEGVNAISMLDVPRQAAWSHRGDFAQLWNKLHGADAWAQNPFVVAITFRVIKANIDAPEAKAAA